MIKQLPHNDYYPFGMLLPNRHASSSNYRYGFNGMEKDDELKGIGNSYDFGARMLDVRVGRWFATDPMFKKLPSYSTYSYALNNPLFYIDKDGKFPDPWIWKIVYYMLYQDARLIKGVAAFEVNSSVSFPAVMGVGSGIAVDSHGNVGLFLSSSKGLSNSIGFGFGIKTEQFTGYDKVTEMRGKGAVLSGELSANALGVPLDGGASMEFDSNLELVGYGMQLSIGFSLPTGPTITGEFTDTRMLAMSGQNFEKFIEMYSISYDVVRKRVDQQNRSFDGSPLYSDGFVRQIATTKRNVSFSKVNPGEGDGLYEMIIGFDVRIIPNSSAPKGATEVNTRENIKTGLIFKMDKNGDMIDSSGVDSGMNNSK